MRAHTSLFRLLAFALFVAIAIIAVKLLKLVCLKVQPIVMQSVGASLVTTGLPFALLDHGGDLKHVLRDDSRVHLALLFGRGCLFAIVVIVGLVVILVT